MVEVHPDENGLVWTVSIHYRKKNKKEKPTEIKKNSLVKEKVGVQRLILIQPVNSEDDSNSTVPEVRPFDKNNHPEVDLDAVAYQDEAVVPSES